MAIGLAFGIISMLGFGFQDYLMAKVSKNINPFKTTFWLESIVLVLLLILSIFFYTYSTISIQTAALLVLTGIVGMVALFSFNKGFEVGQIAVIAPISSGWGAVTAILGVLILSQAITGMQRLDVGVIVLGTVLTSFELRDIRKIRTSKRPLGLKYAVITLFGWGIFYFLLGILAKTLGWFSTSLYLVFLIVVIMVAYGIITKSEFKVKREEYPILVVLAILSLLGLLAYNIGVTYYYASIVAPVSSVAPVITVILALIVLKEKIAANQKLGIALTILGLVALSI